jgi:ABC-type Zn uptake system ZnuABC Zn-binding protein ZnuA
MKRTALLTLLCISLAATVAEAKIRVSSFSTILTEVAERVGGDRIEVTAHVKPGVDPHDFEPKPADLKLVAESQLVLLSAKHMEGYVNKLQEATGGKNTFLEVGDQFPSLKLKGGHDHGHQHGHKHGKGEAVEDPHWWHSVTNVQRAAKVVRDALIKLDAEGKATYAANTDTYLAELADLQKWAKEELAKLPRNKRKLVTSHDAFQYFAQENGFTVYSVEGISTADQPSSKNVAALIKLIKAQGVKAIFAEKIENPKVLQEITRETGAVLGPPLHADGLGEGEAGTYAGMYKHNVSSIVEALK